MKKISFADICAYLSLAISLVLFVLWCCNVGGFTVVSLDSFVGVIVALLAIVVTLAIAWQIYNAVELNKKVEELNSLKSQFDEQKKTIDRITHNFNHHIGHMLGDGEIQHKRMVEAFRFLVFSLMNTMQLDTPLNVDRIIMMMQKAVKGMKDEEIYYEAEYYDDVMKCDQTLRSLANYSFIKNRYEKLFNEFTSKVKRYEEKQ